MNLRPSALWGWFADLNSRQIGVLYLVNCALFFVLGVVAALLIQLDMFTPSSQLTDARWYGTILTGHGMLMVFLVLLPLFPGVFGHLVFPSSVGARDLAMRRTSILGWFCHLSGGLMVIVALLLGAYDNGWTMMMPSAGLSPHYLVLLGGLALSALAVFLPCLAMARTLLSKRFRTVRLPQLPLFAWFLLFGALVQLLVTPIRLVTLAVMFGGQVWGWTFFSLTDADGIMRYQQAFWLYAGPATLSLILPAIGVTFEILAARTGRPIESRTTLIGAGLALTLLGVASWSQHLAGAADKELLISIGSMLGLLMVPPAALILLHWVRSIAQLRPPFTAPDAFVLVVTLCFAMTGLAGATLAIPAVGIHLHNTYFTVAHLHLAFVGSILGAILAGFFHFWPQWWRSSYSRRLGKLSAIGMLAGICLTFLPMTILGAHGLPQSLHVYPEEYQLLHTVSSIGSLLLVISLITTVAVLIWSAVRRPDSMAPLENNGEFSYASMAIRPIERNRT